MSVWFTVMHNQRCLLKLPQDDAIPTCPLGMPFASAVFSESVYPGALFTHPKPMNPRNVLLCTGITIYLACTAPATTINVAANPLWTDTGITLSGETVSIRASGSWRWAFGETVGPEGGVVSDASDEWVPNFQHGQLIAFVGDDPFALPYNAGNYFAVGSIGTFSGLSGKLWLGFNDDRVSEAVSDNAGSVTATISVPDQGTTLLLLSISLFSLALLQRHLGGGHIRPLGASHLAH